MKKKLTVNIIALTILPLFLTGCYTQLATQNDLNSTIPSNQSYDDYAYQDGKYYSRSAGGEFKITEEHDIVEIILINKEEGFITLISKGVVGIVGIYVESEFSLFPSYIEIHILPRSV